MTITPETITNLEDDCIHIAEIAVGKEGGSATGVDIDTSADRLGQVKKTLPKILEEMQNTTVSVLQLKNDLANDTDPARGAGMLGYKGRTVFDRLADVIYVTDYPFSAVGDSNGSTGNGTDNTAAIQAALDYAGSKGGGTVKLAPSLGQYRITSGLKIPSYVTLEGPAPDRFPFNGGNPLAGCLFADFTDANQWIVEPKTTVGGTAVPYNVIINNGDDLSFTYNCCVRDLFIRAAGIIPFGAVRMHGCPGSMVNNVSAVGTGAGLLVNMSFGGSYSFHALTKYYGAIGWSNCNANNFELYCSQETPLSTTVPVAYQMPFLSALNGALLADGLQTEDHSARPWGLVIGGTASDTSTGCRIDYTGERYSGGVFQRYSYGNSFGKCYMEGAANEMVYGLVGSNSKFTVDNLHCFLSSTGHVVDFGKNLNVGVSGFGLISASSYGYGPFLENASRATYIGVDRSQFGPAAPQYNIAYPTSAGIPKIPAILQNGWVDAGGGLLTAVSYRFNDRLGVVELFGAVDSGTLPLAFDLPAGYRPLNRVVRATADGDKVIVDPDGNVYVYAGAGHTYVHIDGVFFEALL